MNIYKDCPQAPCKGCEDRWMNEHTTCHGTCERFLEFERVRTAKRDEMRKKADQMRMLNAIGRNYYK